MDVRDGFTGSIGNTPLLQLRQASEETACTILGKAEFMNPGGSVKDRAALYIILDAEQQGALEPGGVVVEGFQLQIVVAVAGEQVDGLHQGPGPDEGRVDRGEASGRGTVS